MEKWTLLGRGLVLQPDIKGILGFQTLHFFTPVLPGAKRSITYSPASFCHDYFLTINPQNYATKPKLRLSNCSLLF